MRFTKTKTYSEGIKRPSPGKSELLTTFPWGTLCGEGVAERKFSEIHGGHSFQNLVMKDFGIFREGLPHA